MRCWIDFSLSLSSHFPSSFSFLPLLSLIILPLPLSFPFFFYFLPFLSSIAFALLFLTKTTLFSLSLPQPMENCLCKRYFIFLFSSVCSVNPLFLFSFISYSYLYSYILHTYVLCTSLHCFTILKRKLKEFCVL